MLWLFKVSPLCFLCILWQILTYYEFINFSLPNFLSSCFFSVLPASSDVKASLPFMLPAQNTIERAPIEVSPVFSVKELGPVPAPSPAGIEILAVARQGLKLHRLDPGPTGLPAPPHPP